MKNLALAIVIVAIVAAGNFFACREDLAGTARVAISFIGPLFACAIFAALTLHRAEMLRPLLTFRPGDFTRGFVVAAILFGGTFAATHFLFPLGSNQSSLLLRLYLQLGDPRELRDHVPFVVIAIAIAAVCEEIVFRAAIPFLLEEVVGSRRAWIYSAVVYAVAQLPTAYALRTKEGGLNFLLPAAALGCGLFWGYLVRRFERLWPSIISHALFDWCVVMMFRLYGSSV